CQQHDNFPYTF
nr:immunoglobulin light chain junction region [Macaca mulatta]MOX08743.1 immunoglobulin light chain junction region [Macaca mulatta]MOX09001.1 immunoglobulin light chain junction region [Macaca mulatta]MOX09094.1 immunoglobulin light chain junction region [Macaca mulatta]MOX10292.1 immunoglobulin light chain junction region [Macaca mulatta]